MPSRACTPASHDLLAPAASDAVEDGATIVYKRGRLLKLSIDGVSRDVWTTAPPSPPRCSSSASARRRSRPCRVRERLPLGATDIAIRTPKRVSVQHDGTTQQVTTTDATVGQLVAELGLDLSPTDRMSATTRTPRSPTACASW